mmetsp:Transcript_46510/g.145822  ORF Transcript_46510/g.145822 Transcript_46510/m.145822 type:complete len:232 (+) Transcript_46510:680-1375(+)
MDQRLDEGQFLPSGRAQALVQVRQGGLRRVFALVHSLLSSVMEWLAEDLLAAVHWQSSLDGVEDLLSSILEWLVEEPLAAVHRQSLDGVEDLGHILRRRGQTPPSVHGLCHRAQATFTEARGPSRGAGGGRRQDGAAHGCGGASPRGRHDLGSLCRTHAKLRSLALHGLPHLVRELRPLFAHGGGRCRDGAAHVGGSGRLLVSCTHCRLQRTHVVHPPGLLLRELGTAPAT